MSSLFYNVTAKYRSLPTTHFMTAVIRNRVYSLSSKNRVGREYLKNE
ncbi:hypothetical protein MPR_1272 [Myroides profundi]|nr:hypothetical protein MPR_1272 [Myroides profundi]